MREDVQQAREIGELSNAVKTTNAILIRMENKLDSAVAVIGNHSETISKLSAIVSASSGRLEYIEEILEGRKAKNGGILWEINELNKFKDKQCQLQEENRKSFKDMLFKAVGVIGTAFLTGWLVAKGILMK